MSAETERILDRDIANRETRRPHDSGLLHPDQALQCVLDAARPREPRRIGVSAACGWILAEDVCADHAYPPFFRAMMDGYAVRVADAGRTLPVVDQVAAGDCRRLRVKSGQCLEIMTGAPCPAGTETVVPKEHVVRRNNEVTLPAQLMKDQHIAARGSECAAGSAVLRRGDVVTPLAVAVMATFGLQSVAVVPPPSLAIVTTGAELVPHAQRPITGQIRDSNGPMLAAMAEGQRLSRPFCLHAKDDANAILQVLERTAENDIVLITGGVSVGTYDLVPEVLSAYGAECVFHKVSQKPGKPMLFATKGSQLIFGLPGNPLACHLGFERYVAAAIRSMVGRNTVPEPWQGRLTTELRSRSDRTFFPLALAHRSALPSAGWAVSPLFAVSSADVFTPSRANCYLQIEPGTGALPAESIVPFTWISNWIPEGKNLHEPDTHRRRKEPW